MVFKNTKRILAVIVAGVMVVGASVTSFAAGGVDGAGVVEYDNSEAIVYDKIGVQTLTAADYDFTLDPTGQLHRYAPSKYDAGTVYFQSYATRASIEGTTPDGGSKTKLYKKGYDEATNTSGVYGSVVTAFDTDNVTIKTIDAGPFYVYVPDTTSDPNYTKGYMGKYEQLNVTDDDEFNINNYFVISGDAADKTIKARQDNLAGPYVFDGKLYVDSYTEYTGDKITDSDIDPLSNYVTLATDGKSISDVVTGANLYKEGTTSGTYVAATKADLDLTAAVVKGQATTKTHTVENKSTYAKTVKAVVTISNVEGITFQDTNSFETDDKSASMYLAVTNGTGTGTTTVPLEAQADGTAKATYTVDLAAPTVNEITYMDESKNAKTGGHNYYRYEGAAATYGADTFWLTAAANPNADAKAAWDAWAATIADEDSRPAINIVYTVETKQEAPTQASISATNSVPSTGDITVTVTPGTDSKTLTGLTVSAYDGDLLTMTTGYGASYANNTITIGDKLAAYLRSADASALADITFTATFGTGDEAYTKTFKFTKD